MKLFKPSSIFIGILLILLRTVNVQGEDVKMYNQPPSAEEMGRVLFDEKPKMRSINFGKKATSKTGIGSTSSVPEEYDSSKNIIGLPIKFAYNSDEIMDESVPYLEEVGRMLNLEDYAKARLVIEGHTDSIGSAHYNKTLSKRRAQKVRHFLRKNFHIASSRLFVKGLGESKPLPGYNPEDEINRRVQFYRL